MSAIQTLQRHFHEEIALGSSFTAKPEGGSCRHTACTADEELSLILAVEIDEQITLHEIFRHAIGTCQTCFLVAGEHTLNGAMLQSVVFEHGKFHGTAYAIVSPQCGALGLQPFTVNIGFDGVVVKIDIHINQLLAHHVSMALQNQRLPVFIPLGGRFADNHISGFVNHGFQTMFFSKRA